MVLIKSSETILPKEAEQISKKRIIILGAGFGGLATARHLGHVFHKTSLLRKEYEIILVDRRNVHTYTPGLYEVATALREEASPLILKKTAAISLEESLRGLPIRFLQDEVTAVDCERLLVTLRDSGELSASFLVVALGAVTNTFNVPGVEAYAKSIRTFEDALSIRGAVENALSQNPEARIIIAGGGATGVELGGELSTLVKHLQRKFQKKTKASITLLDAGPRLVQGLSEKGARAVHRRLEHLGLTIRLNTRLSSVESNHATVTSPDGKNELLPFDLFIWSGGIKPSPLAGHIAAPKDARGRCMVGPDLRALGHERVFAVGDLTCLANPKSEQPPPSTAYIALAEGKVAAQNILALLAQKPLRQFLPPAHPPMIVPVGGKWAVAYVFGLTFSGGAAFVLRLLVDFRYFLKALRPIQATRFFITSTLVYFRND